jgi:hypothetical protein
MATFGDVPGFRLTHHRPGHAIDLNLPPGTDLEAAALRVTAAVQSAYDVLQRLRDIRAGAKVYGQQREKALAAGAELLGGHVTPEGAIAVDEATLERIRTSAAAAPLDAWQHFTGIPIVLDAPVDEPPC